MALRENPRVYKGLTLALKPEPPASTHFEHVRPHGSRRLRFSQRFTQYEPTDISFSPDSQDHEDQTPEVVTVNLELHPTKKSFNKYDWTRYHMMDSYAGLPMVIQHQRKWLQTMAEEHIEWAQYMPDAKPLKSASRLPADATVYYPGGIEARPTQYYPGLLSENSSSYRPSITPGHNSRQKRKTPTTKSSHHPGLTSATNSFHPGPTPAPTAYLPATATSLRSFIPELTDLDLDPLRFPNMARLLDHYGSPKETDSGHTLANNTSVISGLVGLPMISCGGSERQKSATKAPTVQSDVTSYSHDEASQQPKPNTPVTTADTEQALFVSYQSIDIHSPTHQHHQRIIDKNAPTNSGMIRGIKYKM